jgi:hypothetical protein
MSVFTRVLRGICAVAAGLVFVESASAQGVFAPGNQIIGGRLDGTNFVQGAVGTDGGNTVYTDNVWPTNEPPLRIIDGAGQKYLNFAELNTGVIITPSAASVARSLTLWTANDAEGRDPATYALYGTNAAIVPDAGPYALSNFSLISEGPLALPATRNLGGTNPLLDANSLTVSFDNSASYTSYLLLFPTVKNEPLVNSMQIAEVQLNVPEPGVLGLAGVGMVALLRRRGR